MSIQINHLFSQSQVCLKGLDRDQHRRMTVPAKNGKCLVPGLCKVVDPVPVRERFGVNIPYRWWKRRCRTSQMYTVIWTMNAAVELRSRRLIIVRTLVLDVLPLGKMLTVVPLTFLLRAATVH